MFRQEHVGALEIAMNDVGRVKEHHSRRDPPRDLELLSTTQRSPCRISPGVSVSMRSMQQIVQATAANEFRHDSDRLLSFEMRKTDESKNVWMPKSRQQLGLQEKPPRLFLDDTSPYRTIVAWFSARFEIGRTVVVVGVVLAPRSRRAG